MRIAVCILAVLLNIAFTVSASLAETKVFLLGGQSNMAGCAITADLHPPYLAPQTDVKFWNKCNTTVGWPPSDPGDAWVDLQGGFGHQYYSGLSMYGPEVSFGYRLNELFPDDEIYLVKYGLTSTNLAVNWNPNGSGAVYNVFKSRVDAALANLTAAGKSPVISGMIWMQGESDAMNPAYAAAYQTNLTNFIAKVRSDFSTPAMPFVIGRINISQYWGTPADNALVRDSQVAVANQVANVSWIETEDIPVWNGSEPGHADPDHYSSQGQLILGTRFANVFNTAPKSLSKVLFDDNFDGGTVGGLPGPAAVGTWALGAGAEDAMKVVNAAPSGPVSAPNCLSIVRTAWNQMNASFERQTNPKDLIRLEMDFYGAQGCMPYVDICNGTTELNWVMATGDGGIIVPTGVGAGTSTATVTYNVGAWNHLMMEYSPGAATFDLKINGNVQTGIPMYQSSSGFDSIGFSCVQNGTDGSGALYDNVKIILNPDFIPIPGDANNDGKVDQADAAALAANWLSAGGWYQGDFNNDGIINDLDAAILAANWRPSGGNASVPEPSAVITIFLGILFTVGPILLKVV